MTLYRASTYLVPTLKEAPREAEVISHQLMLRAGMIRKLASGIYIYLPLGFRVLKKVEEIVREEMDRIGCQEIVMPIIQPAELWKETGRWEVYGDELMRVTDRHGREFGLGPTAEEVVTHLVRRELKSYRELPLTLYQINWKYRDEIRPRFGLMRGREFLMKDAYSFDRDYESAQRSYEQQRAAYGRIIERCGLDYRQVKAATGAIGGQSSHEFMVLADSGEAEIAWCSACSYAANVELAPCVDTGRSEDQEEPAVLEEVATPGMRTVTEVSGFLKVEPGKLVKTLIFEDGETIVAALIPGDADLNEEKLRTVMGIDNLHLADGETVEKITGAPVGFAGPVGLENVRIIADRSIQHRTNLVCGALKRDVHFINVKPGRDFQVTEWADLRKVVEGDPCPECSGRLEIQRGIEVGHVFLLGTKYSEAMGAVYQDETGSDVPVVMGCYGIGVSRLMAAAIEQNHDGKGIIWPESLAPFDVVVLPLEVGGDLQSAAESLAESLVAAGKDVLLDDRDCRPGVKFKDAELIGIPVMITVGKTYRETGKFEVKRRCGGDPEFLTGSALVGRFGRRT